MLGGSAPLFRRAVGAMRTGRDMSKAVYWAARAEREPGLLDDIDQRHRIGRVEPRQPGVVG